MPIDNPVFVVGAPRSGTTLLTAMIAARTDFVSGPETHFWSKRPEQTIESCIRDPRWPSKAVASLEETGLAGSKVVELYGLTSDDLWKYLERETPSARAMLAALFESNGRLGLGQRWVEKTPNHLLHLEQVFQAFPGARVIQIVRDPRDVARSMVGLPWASKSRIANAWVWRKWNAAAMASVQQRGDAVLRVRYEDLLTDTPHVLGAVCAHIGVEFTEAMMRPEGGSSAIASPAEYWKRKNSAAIDPSRAFAWRRTADDLDSTISLLCRDLLTDFGYDSAMASDAQLRVAGMSRRILEHFEADITSAASRGITCTEVPELAPGEVLLPSPWKAIKLGDRRKALNLLRARTQRLLRGLPTRTLRSADFLTATQRSS